MHSRSPDSTWNCRHNTQTQSHTLIPPGKRLHPFEAIRNQLTFCFRSFHPRSPAAPVRVIYLLGGSFSRHFFVQFSLQSSLGVGPGFHRSRRQCCSNIPLESTNPGTKPDSAAGDIGVLWVLEGVGKRMVVIWSAVYWIEERCHRKRSSDIFVYKLYITNHCSCINDVC